VSFTEVLAGFVQNWVFIFGARSTLLRCLFHDTCPPAAFTVVVRSSGRKLRPRRFSVPGAWMARARRPVSLRRACWPRSTFSGRAWRWLGSPVVVPLLGDTGDGAWPPRAAVSGGFCHCLLPEAVLGVSVFCVYSLVSTVSHSLSICNAQMFMSLIGVWLD
jgi:hypothetical protein